MSKKEFLKKLKKALSALPAAERERTLAYYDELIEDRKESGATEESAVYAMGEPQSIAAEILADANERGVELKKRTPFGRAALILLIGFLCGALIWFGTNVIADLVRGGADSGEWEKVEKNIELGSISTINMDMTTVDLVITGSDSEMIRLVYFTNDALVEYNFESSEDTVTLTQRKKRILFDFFSQRNKRSASLFVPEGFTGTIIAKTTTGDLILENVASASALHLSTTTGDMTIHDAKSKYALFGVTTGDMRVSECEFPGDMTASGSTGKVMIKGVRSVKMSVKTTTGDIIMEDAQLSTLDAELTTGGINVNRVAAEKVTLRASTGDVKFDGLDAKSIDISVSTGDVLGTLAGSAEDYTFETHTSTGRNNLPENFGSGERKLKVSASTGDINISFD